MDEPIIYSPWIPCFPPKTPPESLDDKFYNAIKLDDKDEFLRLLDDPEMEEYPRDIFLSQFDVHLILRHNSHQIAMALINGETGGDFQDDDQLVFEDGWTALHLATVTPSPKLITCLIEKGHPVDVPCDYAPLNLKQVTPVDLALEIIDYGYHYGYFLHKRPWTLRCSIFLLFHYVSEHQRIYLEVIRLLVQYTQNKERIRKAFIDSASEGKFIKVVALYLAAPELFLSTSLGGGSMSSIDELYLNLNSFDKTTYIKDGLSLLLDVFDLVGDMLIAYVRVDDDKVFDLERITTSGFFIREVAHKKLEISSRDDYLLSLFKPVSEHAFEPACIPPNKDGKKIYFSTLWLWFPFQTSRDHIDIDYINSEIPSLKPHEADDLRKAIDNKLSIMRKIRTLL